MAANRYTARRLGWNETIAPEHSLDLEPVEGADDVLTGELTELRVDATEFTPPMTITLVGGQQADPATVRPARPTTDSPEQGA